MGDTETEIFTRGGPDVPDNRGQSMVAKHFDKLQQEKESKAMAKLEALMPQIGAAVRAVALQECDWNEDRALMTLRRFQLAKASDLTALQKERKKHQEVKRSKAAGASDGRKQRQQKSSGSESQSDDDNSNSDTDSSDSDSDRKRKRRRSRSPKRSSKDKKRRKRDEKDKKKHKKRSKKESTKDKKRSKDKDKARAKSTAAAQEWGKHGIIRESDMYDKRPEFTLWATEVKKLDIEALPKYEEKELFKTYMEDYNTGTLPHRKYYDLELYERQKASKSGSGGGGRERNAFNDEEERKRELAAERARQHQERLKAAYEELKTGDKAEEMRQQELLRAKMSLAYRMGDETEARRLAERLKPEDK